MRQIIEKVVFVLILALFIGSLFVTKEPKDMSLSEINEALFSEGLIEGTQSGDDMMIKRAYGLNRNDYEGILYYAPESNMDAQEFFLVKLSDESQKDDVTEAIESRLEVQKKNFDGYGTDQTDLLNRAVVWQSGNYVCLISADEPEVWLEALKKVLGV